jgi:hypothetical protein
VKTILVLALLTLSACQTIRPNPICRTVAASRDVAIARVSALLIRCGLSVEQSPGVVTASGSLDYVQTELGAVCDCGTGLAGEVMAKDGLLRAIFEPRGDSCFVTVFVTGRVGFIRCGSSGRLEEKIFTVLAAP